MNIIGEVLVLSALVKYIVEELKKQVIPAKWIAGITDIWGLVVSLVICLMLPSLRFLSGVIGDDLFVMSIGERIGLALIVAFGSGFMNSLQSKFLDGGK
jgi:hypothetical protein